MVAARFCLPFGSLPGRIWNAAAVHKPIKKAHFPPSYQPLASHQPTWRAFEKHSMYQHMVMRHTMKTKANKALPPHGCYRTRLMRQKTSCPAGRMGDVPSALWRKYTVSPARCSFCELLIRMLLGNWAWLEDHNLLRLTFFSKLKCFYFRGCCDSFVAGSFIDK